MTINSKYFDKIRIKPAGKPRAEPESKTCEWDGCSAKAEHRAPKGRGAEGKYHHFCLDHVREYNKTYNYFSGMSNSETWDYQKMAATGERPTWRMGVNGAAQNGRRRIFAGSRKFSGFTVNDGYGLFDGQSIDGERGSGPKRERHVKALERRSLETLGLDTEASGESIRARYKDLVKKHHPDANGGDRSSEDRLREIIQAYKHLKAAGFC